MIYRARELAGQGNVRADAATVCPTSGVEDIISANISDPRGQFSCVGLELEGTSNAGAQAAQTP